MKIIKKIAKIGVYLLCLTLVIVVGFIGLTSRFTIPGGYKFFSVITGSMSPTIPEGSLILSRIPRSENEIYKNMIITFEQPGYKNKFITHRVYQLLRDETGLLFSTKGDKNEGPDSWVLPYGRVKGIYRGHIPFLGSLFSYIKSPVGLIIFIIIPTLLLIFQELKTIMGVVVSIKLENKNS